MTTWKKTMDRLNQLASVNDLANRERAKRIIQQSSMTEKGMKLIELATQTGKLEALRGAATVIP
jgi:hypothetical protein